MTRLSVLLLGAVLTLDGKQSTVCGQEPAIIAMEQQYSLQVNTTASDAFTQIIGSAGAAFLSLHFDHFHFAPGSALTVRSADNLTRYTYTGLGRGDLGESGGFFSSLIPGAEAVLEYASGAAAANASGDFGFSIDLLTRSSNDGSTSTICGSDDSLPAKCYENDSALPKAYTKARAVARLFINGSATCTGLLVGSEGHLLTNFHCISSESEAATTDFELSAESASCSEQCQVRLGCRGKVVATTSTLVASSEDLDYAFVKLTPTMDANLSAYGYLQLRVAGAELGEQIYIPQQPKGWAKRIAAVDDDGKDTTVLGVDHTSVCGKHRVVYDADTQRGSSGSPVIAAADNAVVALHNCGNLDDTCENSAIDIRAVISDLRDKGVVPEDALDDPSAAVPNGPWLPGSGVTSAPTPTSTPKPVVSICTIFRQQISCETVVPGNECVWKDGACVANE